MFQVLGGTIDGGNVMTNHGAITVAGTAALTSFTNAADGTVTQKADTTFGGATINQGQWNIAGDFALNQGSNATFHNNATVRKTAGAGTSLIYGNFYGDGQTLAADTGTLQLATASTWTGGAQLVPAAGAKIAFQGVTDRPLQVRLTGVLAGSGAGRVEFDDGEIYSYDGASLNFPSGQLHVTGTTLNGLDNTGDLTVDSGTVGARHLPEPHGTILESGTGAITYGGRVTNAGRITLANDNGLHRGSELDPRQPRHDRPLGQHRQRQPARELRQPRHGRRAQRHAHARAARRSARPPP